jgi:tetratricopeptide (TPR) repeat protein
MGKNLVFQRLTPGSGEGIPIVKALVLNLILISQVGLANVALAQAAPPLAGKLVYLQGQVAVRPARGQEWGVARIDQDLFAGDAVRTGPLSRAAILCVDESQLKLNEDTVIVLNAAVPSPRLRLGEVLPVALPERVPSLYAVPQGEIWLRNKNEKFRFELETPAVTAAIRGTEFNLRVAADGATRITLLEGSLNLANPYGQMVLNPGEEGLARPGQAPTKRLLVQPADAVQWALYYPGILSYRDLPLSAPEGRSPAGSPALAALVRQGEASYDRGDLTQARQAAECALKQDPHNSRALTLMGWLSLQAHALEEARVYFQRVPQPDDRTFIGEGLARYRLGDGPGAYALLRKARGQLGPTPLLVALTGYFALLVGQVDEARAQLQTAVSLAPSLALPRALLAQISIVQSRKEAALKDATEAVRQAPHSPLAQLTLGLVKIASFDLPAARFHLEKALGADPRFVDAYLYLAKIWLGADYLNRAWRTLKPALRLAPGEGEVLALAGFIRLAYRDYAGAEKFFLQAIKVNPSLGEPHLGLGHCYFRYRQYDQGLAAILTATLLEPRVALFQSFLGKALYQVRAFDKALEIYDYAKTLDPQDPTPYYYKGIALTDLNRPGEAVQEINRSIELNDNRAIYRSRIMLDRDLAVRNFDLARAYTQLGLGDWAFSKAVTSVKSDPLTSSSHLFLAASYTATRQRVGSAGTELTLYRLLSPANENTFSIFTDYTPMFEMPYFRILAQGGIGSWDRRRAIQDHALEAYGGLPGLAFDVSGFYQDDRGFRRLNSDRTFIFSTNMVKWEPTVKDSLFASYAYSDWEYGDDSNLNDFGYRNAPGLRNYSHWRTYELGYVHRFSPRSTFLTYFTYQNLDNHQVDWPHIISDLGGGWQLDLFNTRRLTPQEFINFQGQQQLILGKHTLIGGFDYFHGHLKYRLRDEYLLTWLNIPIWRFEDGLDYRPPNRTYTFYLLDYWRLTPKLLVELGVFKDFAKNFRYGYEKPLSNSLWSPRLGLNYQITPRHTLRFTLQRSLNTHTLSPLLVPSEIASFPWQINVDDGALVRELGLAWEAQWDPRTYSVLRLDGHRIDIPMWEPFFQDSQIREHRVWWGWKRYLASLNINRILSPSWGLALGVTGKKIDPSFQDSHDFTEYNAFLGLSFRHRSGWLGSIRQFLVRQDLTDRGDNLFGLTDVRLGYEFPQKRGLATLEITNLFNRHFYFEKEFVTLDAFYPVRRVLFRLALYF